MSNDHLELLRASLESSALPENVEINPVTENTTTDLTSALDDLIEDTAQVVIAEATVDTLVDTEASMEAYSRYLNTLRADGGMTAQTAGMYQVALEDRLKHIPFANKESLFLSLEAFGGSKPQAIAHDASTKGLAQKLRDIYVAVKNSVIGFFEHIWEWTQNLFRSGDALIAAGQDLKKRAAANKGGSQGKITDKRALKMLSTDGHYASEVTQPLTVMQAALQVALVEFPQAYGKGLKPLADMIKTGKISKDGLLESIGAAATSIISINSKSMELPGGASYQITVKDTAPKNVDELASMVSARLVSGNASGPAEIDALSPSDVARLGAEVEKMGRLIRNYERNFKAIITEQRKFLESGTKLIAGSSEFTAEEGTAAKQTISKMSNLAKGAVGGSPQLIAHAVKVCKAAVVLGRASLSGATEKAALPAPAA